MLRTKPKLSYCGLTIVLSNPGRFDKLNLISANGGVFFNNHCLAPEFNTMQCDIRLMEDVSPLIPGTKCIFILGEKAMWAWCPDSHKNFLNELRGSPIYNGQTPVMVSFPPQDAADVKNHEAKLNPLSENYGEGDSDEDGDEKSLGPTAFHNYGFWLKRDTWKVKQLLKNNWDKWPTQPEPKIYLFPPSEEVINILRTTKNELMYFDIETDIEERNLLCFAFSFDGKSVYSVPILNNEYRWAYSSLPSIFRATAIAFKNNCVVGHNISGFDLFVFGYKYHIPSYKAYDTMLSQHRIFPEVEISLAHTVSYWLWERFHKDVDSEAYFTREHMMQKLKYCALDVARLKPIKDAQDAFAKTIPGLTDSIALVNRSIIPYLVTSLQGIKFREDKVKEIIKENDRLMEQYNRIIEVLVGEQGLKDARDSISSKKKGLFPGSTTQCVDYFHRQLGYEVIHRSTKTNKPSLGKASLYKLALAHNNPVIKLINLYRAVQKETGALDFNPWKDDNGKVMPWLRIKPDEDRYEFD